MTFPDARHLPRVALTAALFGATGCHGGSTGAERRDAAVPVAVVDATREAVPLQVRAFGNVEAKNSVAVRAQVGGMLNAVHFREGDEVKAGALLFTLDPRPFRAALHAAQAQLTRNRVLLAKAEEDTRRYAELVKRSFVTQEQADDRRAAAASLAAAVQADAAAVEAATLQLDYCTIRAPIAGRVGRALVDPGNLVRANEAQPLVMLLQTRPVDVTFSLPEPILPALRAALGGEPLAATALPPGAAIPVTGRLVFVDNAVDAATGTLLLQAEFSNDDGALLPGQFVDVTLTLRVDAEALVVPTEAVQTGRDGTYVFVVQPDDTVVLRPVVVDREADGLTLVASGLAPGETVVRDGQLRLSPGVRVERRAAGETPAR